MSFTQALWNPKFHSRMMRRASAMAKKPSPIERKVKAYLKEMGQDFCSQEIINGYIVDFMHPEWKLIIECDGHQWHSSEMQRVRDSVRDAVLEKEGYSILHLLGWQCWNKPICKGLIRDFLKAHRHE